MYDKPLTLNIIAVTPFAFGNDEEMHTGLTITTQREGTSDDLEDLMGDCFELLKPIVDGDMPIDGFIKLKFTKREDLLLQMKELKRTISCEISSIDIAMIGDEAITIKTKIKMQNVDSVSMGIICNSLRQERKIALLTTQQEIKFK
jgi:hypothetical protein